MTTFREFCRECWKQLGAWGYSDETRESYERKWLQFLAYVKSRGGHDDIRSFNDRFVFDFAVWLGQAVRDERGEVLRPAAHPNTIVGSLTALSTLAKYGMMARDTKDRRVISEDPTRSFRWPTRQHEETKWAHPAEVRAIADTVVPIHKAIARDVLIETGIRRGQARRLNVEHFHEAQGRYFLSVTMKGRGQQRHRQTKDLPISKGLGEAIRAWLQVRDVDRIQTEPDCPLLLNGQRRRWSPTGLSNMIADLGRTAGVTRLSLSPHKLRHSKNVRDRLANLDQVQRARLNLHTSLRSQERYDHILDGELHQAAEASFEELQRWLGEPNRHVADEGPACRSDQAVNPAKDEDER